MIPALFALALAGPGDLPGGLRLEEAAPGVEAFLRLRAGAWIARGFEFEALRADSKEVRSDGQGMASAGVDFGFVIADHFVIFGSADYSATDDIHAQTAGAAIGWRDRAAPDASAGVPDEVTIYAGALWGTFEVDEPDFGDFDDAVGLRAGILITYQLSPSVAASAVGEYRLLEFDYEEKVLEGDDQAGGSGGWVGLGLEFRF